MATIKAIEKTSVHHIQSGQVIVDLTSVVKELVENSLDAGASSIDVRFKNQGLDSVEIQDNGNGIAPEDFASVALKHYTSKLTNFEDLDSLITFGFRGEALSSLSALSTLKITTARAEDGVVGNRLEFETSGKLKSTTVVAAQKGTSVVAENIFHNLPVRKKALEKNIQREYTKALRFLESCACIAANIKFSVSNQPSKGNRKVAFSTNGNNTIRENVTNVFGAKTVSALIKLNLKLTPDSWQTSSEAQDLGIAPPSTMSQVEVEGFVSRPNWGEGRQAQDRQMLFVNSRPCLLPQVAKAFNEVYKSYNHHQHPFILANFIMDTSAYDVNVSPDKRTIMLHDQTAILEQLKQALIKLFDKVEHTVPQGQLQAQTLPAFKPLTDARKKTAEQTHTNTSEHGAGQDTFARAVPAAPRSPSVNLIESWAGRDSTARKADSPAEQSRPPSAAQSLDKSPGPDIQTFGTHDPVPKSTVYGDRTEAMKAGPITLPQADLPQSSSFAFGTPIQNILANSSFRPGQSRDTGSRPISSHGRTGKGGSAPTSLHREAEAEIPSTFNARPAVARGPIDDAFAKMRPRRDSPEIAEITIGDNSITTIVGEANPNKKRRIHRFHDSAIDLSSSPMPNRGLLDFTAPGSALEEDAIHSREQRSPHEEGLFCDHSEDEEEAVGGHESTPEISPTVDHELDALLMREESILFDEHDESAPDPVNEESEAIDNDEQRKKRLEEKRVAHLIDQAEHASTPQSNAAGRRMLAREFSKDDEAPLSYQCAIRTSTDAITQSAIAASQVSIQASNAASPADRCDSDEELDAESRLSLTVSKSDFEHMHIVGQFNLGFILALRPSKEQGGQDELFIIDQHAADEKYNYERFRNALVLQSQRLVQPKTLELSAVEQEVVLNHLEALKANGFNIEIAEHDGEESSSRTFRLTSLPMSANRTFTISDLEELLHLLSDLPSGSSEIPRPRKVQQMLAMRACRSSIMVGKTLTSKQMEGVVRHMGEMEKPWNCPHGRPTMRHLSSLGSWHEWREEHLADNSLTGSAAVRSSTDWKSWLSAQA